MKIYVHIYTQINHFHSILRFFCGCSEIYQLANEVMVNLLTVYKIETTKITFDYHIIIISLSVIRNFLPQKLKITLSVDTFSWINLCLFALMKFLNEY